MHLSSPTYLRGCLHDWALKSETKFFVEIFILLFQLLDMEAALAAQDDADTEYHSLDSQNLEITVISSKESSNLNTPEERCWAEISTALLKGHREHNGFIMPIILINDEPAEDLDQKWLNIVEKATNNDKMKGFQSRRKFKRKFCRKRRYAAFKRSYSIG